MPHAQINGARLWYEVLGQGEPLLLHHGFTASRVNWMPVAKRLKDRFKIILMECRGTGESEDTDDGYNLEQYANDVIGMVDHLEIDKFSYAGHSMGGGIGYLLGLNHADRLNRLILMAPIPSGGPPGEPDQDMISKRLQARKKNDRHFFKAEYEAARFRKDVQTDAWFESRVDHVMRVSEGHFVEGLRTMRQLNVEDQLALIDLPTLMLAGAVDSLLKSNLRDFMRLPNASLHVFSRAGHEVAMHEPDGVSDAINEFMLHGPVNV